MAVGQTRHSNHLTLEFLSGEISVYTKLPLCAHYNQAVHERGVVPLNVAAERRMRFLIVARIAS